MKRGRRSLLVGGALAAFGVYLAFDGWRSGSLFRYQLMGYAACGALCVPLALRLLLGAERGSWFLRRTLFVAVLLLLCLVLGEVVVRLFGPERELPAQLREDPRLGHALEPGTAGSDARGWRNSEAVDRTDVLFVGDSQTYGFGVEIDETFCERSEAPERSCYQMANGSYGPIQYVELLRRGLALRPKVAVVTVYFGNDLVDAPDYTGLAGAEELRAGQQPPRVRPDPVPQAAYAPNLTMALVDGVLSNSHLLDLAARVVKQRLRGGALDVDAGSVPFEHATAGTVWQPAYRHRALKPGKNVSDGIAITRRCLERMAALCAEANVRLVVASLPTKERTYAAWLGKAAPSLQSLAADEQRAFDAIFGQPLAANIEHVELLPVLVAAMEAGRMPWFVTADGHLAPTGHQVVAEELARLW